LSCLLPVDAPLATIVTMVEVDPTDPAFAEPSAFVGPSYGKALADRLAIARGWTLRRDGRRWRRVVPAPEPMRLVETRPVRWLMDKGAVVVCAGGGGVSTVSGSGQTERVVTGVEAVVDGDRVGQLLARELRADLFVMVTDVDAVYDGWATEHQRRIPWVTAAELRRHRFDVASMAPKAEAAIRFVEGTGRRAAIGALTDVEAIVN